MNYEVMKLPPYITKAQCYLKTIDGSLGEYKNSSYILVQLCWYNNLNSKKNYVIVINKIMNVST